MAYDNTLSVIGGLGSYGNTIWAYTNVSDTKNTILSGGYFNSASSQLTQYDFICIAGSDGTALITVTSARGAGSVTTGLAGAAATIENGTITSAMVQDGALMNIDINESANIAFSKLAQLTSGNILVGNAGNVPTSTALTGPVGINNAGLTSITDDAITTAMIASNAVTGDQIATYAVDDLGAGVLLQLAFDTAGGASANPEKTLTYKFTITGVEVINKANGTPGDTIQIQTASGAANITNVINVGGTTGTTSAASQTFVANSVIAAGAAIRIAQVDGGGSDSPACRVILRGFKTA